MAKCYFDWSKFVGRDVHIRWADIDNNDPDCWHEFRIIAVTDWKDDQCIWLMGLPQNGVEHNGKPFTEFGSKIIGFSCDGEKFATF